MRSDEKQEASEQLHEATDATTPIEETTIGLNALDPTYVQEALQVGQIVADRYRVECLLAQGGMGSVYKVVQIFLQKQFALKTLNPGTMSSGSWRRFQKEARAASLLDHPALIKVHDFGMIEDKQPFFVMDFYEGDTLSEYLKRDGPLPLDAGLSIFIQVCFGLAYAHSQGVVHRDIKPSNIMLSRNQKHGESDSDVKIVDFGIAKLVNLEDSDALSLTRTGEVFGTPYYMSPEQCLGITLDHRSDIYSLGCVMFEALTGLPPCIGDSALAIMMKHQSELPPSLKQASLGTEFPEAVERIIAKMIEKKPEDRYQNLLDAASDLGRLKMGHRVEVKTHERAKTKDDEPGEGYIKRNSAIIIAVVLAAIAFGVGRLSAPPKVSPPPNPVPAVPAAPVATPLVKTIINPSKGVFFSDVLEGNARVFHFPTDHNLGTLYNFSRKMKLIQKPYTIPFGGSFDAQGEVQAENFEALGFLPSRYVTSEHPELLRKFRRDELQAIDFAEEPYATDDLVKSIARDFDVWSLGFGGSKGVTDQSLQYINGMRGLTSLDISDTHITGGALAKMKQLTALKRLHGERLTDAHKVVLQLANSKAIEQLLLRDGNLTDEDALILSKLKTLKRIDVSGSSAITDRGAEYLSHLPNLEEVSLTGCNITPASIEYAKRMPNLKRFAVHLDHWTDADIARFKTTLPYVELWPHHIPYHDFRVR